MTSQFALQWNSYTNNVCEGFCSLQKNGEFVDMTLAADGHFVKVHQLLVALSSPYLKSLISSAPCQHPVIFLNNVSNSTLMLLLEYIYTGEVLVPPDSLSQFIEAAKSLHVKGLENIDGSSGMIKQPSVANSSINNVLPDSNDRVLQSNVHKQACEKEYNTKDVSADCNITSSTKNDSCITIENEEDVDMPVTDLDDDVGDEAIVKDELKTSKLQYTVSIRGYIQVILNRYIYNLQSKNSSRLKRWRCVNYQRQRCLAGLVTDGNTVVKRINPHCHSFHDKKIISKIKNNTVYETLVDVETHQRLNQRKLLEKNHLPINND
ncbi:protein abrupt-like [Leptidea sinapis]|uniref:protein abrupt-like n=1 Tax=Leptidea sinapis TaxID=189913 RepID=UPI00214663A6|nr:protein abrupt-like [Leptidea sinapis]